MSHRKSKRKKTKHHKSPATHRVCDACGKVCRRGSQHICKGGEKRSNGSSLFAS